VTLAFKEKPVIIAYGAYLGMSMTNPLFFSSMGMLVLASLLAKIALFEHDLRHRSNVGAAYRRRAIRFGRREPLTGAQLRFATLDAISS